MNNRLRNKDLERKIISADEAASIIKDGMNVGTSGFTPAGYPKSTPLALAHQAEEGRDLRINLWTGASVGDELDGALSRAGVIDSRLPYQTNEDMRAALNSQLDAGGVEFQDHHLSHVAQQVRYGFFGKLDIAIVEACAITEDGNIIPTTSIGNAPVYVQEADKVIVEINEEQPIELEKMHDIYLPENPPNRDPIPITDPGDKIGTKYMPCDESKIAGIVKSNILDTPRELAPIDKTSEKMAENLINFLEKEIGEGRLEDGFALQSGVGSVANAVLAGLSDSDFDDLKFYSEVIQDSAMELIEEGKFSVCSGTSLTPSPEGLEYLLDNIEFFSEEITLRPQEISNNPEVIRRIGSVALNTALEADMYGHVNSTHILGTRMVNGLGGSGDFTRNAYLSVFTTPSIAADGDISNIVPMVSHVDHTEHDVHVIVTEQGVADLRNTSPGERAKKVIENCAHPDYKDLLWEYYEEAVKETGGHHTPHKPGKAHEFHKRFYETGSMKP